MTLNDMIHNLSNLKWEVSTLRMTAFPSPDFQTLSQDWWINVVGEAPEKRTEQPRTGDRLEQSEYKQGRLILQVQPDRVNWIFQAQDELSLELESIPTLGTLKDNLEDFRALVNKWFELDTIPILSRLAFGAVLLQPVESLQVGYEMLNSYLPSVSLNPENTSDFLYQINRRRKSGTRIPDLSINRLEKWSVMVRHFMRLNIGNQTNVSKAPLAYASRLELDINTMQEYEGLLQKEFLSQVFDELIVLGIEIAEKGDIP